jgi:hypothetical protein
MAATMLISQNRTAMFPVYEIPSADARAAGIFMLIFLATLLASLAVFLVFAARTAVAGSENNRDRVKRGVRG